MDKYEIIIYWSADDDAFIAEVPELRAQGKKAHAGVSLHGDQMRFLR